jgi:hypothetical protein
MLTGADPNCGSLAERPVRRAGKHKTLYVIARGGIIRLAGPAADAESRRHGRIGAGVPAEPPAYARPAMAVAARPTDAGQSALAAAGALARKASAPATPRAYKADWQHFADRHCDARDDVGHRLAAENRARPVAQSGRRGASTMLLGHAIPDRTDLVLNNSDTAEQDLPASSERRARRARSTPRWRRPAANVQRYLPHGQV